MTRSQWAGASKSDAAMAHLDWAWFCLRAHQKHEHLAATHLRRLEQVEVFNPRLRFARPNRQKKIWITESLFPGYLFARFNWKDSLSRVHYSPGVQSVVHFGCGWPTVPDQVIEEIRKAVGPDEMCVIADEVSAGDEVKIIGELFYGLTAVVTQVMPERERVAVLLEFLGRQTTVEISTHSIIRHDLRR